MIERLKKFLNNNFGTIMLGVIVFVCLYFAFYFLVGFNMFSARDWGILSHAHFHGVIGITFVVLLITSPLIYLTSLIVIRKTKKPFFTFKKADDKTDKSEDSAKAEDKAEETPEKFPEGLPEEMREQYVRLAKGSLIRGAVSNISNPLPVSENVAKPDSKQSHIPIPPKFDEDTTPNTSAMGLPMPDDFEESETQAPKFKEINFGFSNNSKEDDAENLEHFKTFEKLLMGKGFKDIKNENDIIIAKKNNSQIIALAVHDDPDFWIADEDSWFASGKQKISPIKNLKLVSEQHNAEPILYLTSNNIMDLDKNIKSWEQDNIRIIKDLKDL